jgi:carboxypeptidase Taq
MTEEYQEFEDKVKTINNIGQVKSLLHWDQQVMMPENGVKARSLQNSTLAKIYHQKISSRELGELIVEIETEELALEEKANVREIEREHERALEVPEEIEEKISQKESETFDTWQKAKKEQDFSTVAPDLKELVELKRRYAQEINSDREAYRVLFDDFEPYIEYETMEQILERLKDELTRLVSEIKDSEDIEMDVFDGEFPEERQMDLSKSIVDKMGYDWERGRLDVSEHPFTLGNQFDCRITTRFSEDDLAEGLGATIHECGHALYELGLPQDLYGVPAGTSRDFSVHESQSRLWENHVFKSRKFFDYILPELRERFPDQFEDVSVEDCYRSINRIDPENLIRIEADEITYHLHIVIRWELERDLINGELEVEELPQKWNDKYEEYLGIRPENDAEGVMQDVHWYQGSFGYFTTYSLGSVLAAQIYRQAEKEIDDLEGKISSGEFQELKQWLNENIHQRGSKYRTEELVEKATGEKPTADYFLEYIREKYEELYSL